MKRGRRNGAIRCAAACLAATALQADSASLIHDNDFMFNSDNGYSAGLQIGWMGDSCEGAACADDAYVQAMSSLFSLAGVAFSGRRRTGAISLSEIIITPDDLESSAPVYDDVPYAGALLAGFTLFSEGAEDFDAYTLGIGILGPRSGAERLQKNVHKAVGATDPQGWDNQLGTRGIFQAGYVHALRQYTREEASGYRLEWFNSVHADLGSFFCGAGAGSTLRLGYNMPRNFPAAGGLIGMLPSDMLGLGTRSRPLGWELRAGLFVTGIAYLYLYDEGKRLGYDFDRPRIAPRANIGLSFYRERFRLSLDLFPAGFSDTNPESSSFGRMGMTWWFE